MLQYHTNHGLTCKYVNKMLLHLQQKIVSLIGVTMVKNLNDPFNEDHKVKDLNKFYLSHSYNRQPLLRQTHSHSLSTDDHKGSFRWLLGWVLSAADLDHSLPPSVSLLYLQHGLGHLGEGKLLLHHRTDLQEQEVWSHEVKKIKNKPDFRHVWRGKGQDSLKGLLSTSALHLASK